MIMLSALLYLQSTRNEHKELELLKQIISDFF